jgi:hypothetical protein
MRDLETLVEATWNRDVRPFVDDALRCYNAGAFRSSIVASWTAVCADVFEKVILLSEDGDPQAERTAKKITKARSMVNTSARSSGRCNDISVDLRRRSPVEHLARTTVHLCCDEAHVLEADHVEVGALREVLTKEPVHVLVGGTLPG